MKSYSLAWGFYMIDEKDEQYGLERIMAIWVSIALPMPILAFIIVPLVSKNVSMDKAMVFWLAIILGMMWQCVVSLYILKKELGTLKWSVLKERIRLVKPKSPKIFLWLIPSFIICFLVEVTMFDPITEFVGKQFPGLKELYIPQVTELVTPQYIGARWLLVVALVSNTFNYFLGEELLFRGVLLPKMRGVFGKFDWIANSFLFAFYHMHKPLAIIPIILSNLPQTWTSSYFKSNWFAVILHGVEGVFVIMEVMAAILGLGE